MVPAIRVVGSRRNVLNAAFCLPKIKNKKKIYEEEKTEFLNRSTGGQNPWCEPDFCIFQISLRRCGFHDPHIFQTPLRTESSGCEEHLLNFVMVYSQEVKMQLQFGEIIYSTEVFL